MTRPNRMILMWLCVCLCVPGAVVSEALDMKALVPRETPDGWVTSGSPQVFTKESLFEHINGQADLFLQYGFEKSIFAVYRKDSGRETIDVDVYDMGDSVHAFGVFSRFRQDNHPAGIGLDSYLDDDYAIFYKGKYFVVLQADESNPSGLRRLAKTVESRIVDASPPPKEIMYFPKVGLKPGSIEYYPQGLMGRQFLGKGFKATYVPSENKASKENTGDEGPDSNLFIAVFDNTDELESALESFKEVLSNGKSARGANRALHGLKMVTGEDAYQGKIVIVHKGRYLAGTAGFKSKEVAEGLLADLMKKMD